MPKRSPSRYRTSNWSEYNAALRQRGSLWVWFDPDTVWHAGKTGKRGAARDVLGYRDPNLPDAEGPLRPSAAAE